MGGQWNASLLQQGCKYIVINNVLLSDLDMRKHYKQVLGCQSNFTVTDKYIKKIAIKGWGKPCIYMSNQDPREYEGVDVNWLEGNCVFVKVEVPLFKVRADSPTNSIDVLLDDIDKDSEF
jgi:hypothetical protein